MGRRSINLQPVPTDCTQDSGDAPVGRHWLRSAGRPGGRGAARIPMAMLCFRAGWLGPGPGRFACSADMGRVLGVAGSSQGLLGVVRPVGAGPESCRSLTAGPRRCGSLSARRRNTDGAGGTDGAGDAEHLGVIHFRKISFYILISLNMSYYICVIIVKVFNDC